LGRGTNLGRSETYQANAEGMSPLDLTTGRRDDSSAKYPLMVEFPRCAVCRTSIEPGQHVVFRLDGRARHLACPEVLCAVCARPVLPQEPIRREGLALVHGNCWLRRERQRLDVSTPPDADLLQVLRARLAVGALPSSDPTRVAGGTSPGAVCAGCTGRIMAGQVAYELEFANTVSFRLHRACYLLWDHERTSAPREIRGGSDASVWTFSVDSPAVPGLTPDPTVLDKLILAAAQTVRTAAALQEFSRRICARSAVLCASSRRACQARRARRG